MINDESDGLRYSLPGLITLEGVPLDTPFSLRVCCELDLAVQYTRVDTRQPNLALMTTFVPRAERNA